MKSLTLMLSGEFFFAAFLLAGYFKGGIEWFPIDITFFFLGLSALVAIKRFIKRPSFVENTMKFSIIFLSFFIVIFISFLYSQSYYYALEKILRFSIITAWSTMGVFFLLKSEDSLYRFFKSIGIIASIISIVAIIELVNTISTGTYNGTIFIMDTDYLALGRSVGLGLVVLICSEWYSSKKNKSYINLLILTMLVALLFSGAKMPIIAMTISLIIVLLLTTNIRVTDWKLAFNNGSKKLLLLVGSFIVLLIPVSYTDIIGKLFRRLGILFSGADQSVLERLTLYQTAINMFKSQPFNGAGWATFPLYYYGTDEKVYPHNIFLEISSELGLLGLLIFIMLLLFALYHGYLKLIKKGKSIDYIQLTVIASTVFFFLNANTSGDITDNKILFTFLALLSITSKIDRRKQLMSGQHE